MITRRIVLHFPSRLVDQPIISRLVREFNLDFNILKASVTPREEGLLILEISGGDKDYKNAVDYLKKQGVKTQFLDQDVTRNEKRCTHCGACVSICPAGALIVDPLTREVAFLSEKCIACELCIPACPLGAMEVHY